MRQRRRCEQSDSDPCAVRAKLTLDNETYATDRQTRCR
jgi:hypothetical protein